MISITSRSTDIVIRNCGLTVRLPLTFAGDGACPGPLLAWSLNGHDWNGICRMTKAPGGASLETQVDSSPASVCWQTSYQWGGKIRLIFSGEWLAGADTICVAEEIASDTDASIEWHPFGAAGALAYAGGGGEVSGPMQPILWRTVPGADETMPRILARLSHISYFNQWCQAWVGFAQKSAAPELGRNRAPFFGVFSGWASQWRRRGYVRPEVVESEAGHYLRMPIKEGSRRYGIVLAEACPASAGRSILNTRKIGYSDLPPVKTENWRLDLKPSPKSLRLLPQPLPSRLPLRSVDEILAAGAAWEKRAREGGYEGIVINQGRELKSLAFDFDALWALGKMSEEEYGRAARSFLLLAYIFSDPDYCRYEDFWPGLEPNEGIVEALRDEMGDCPVPPNFASEFFSVVGVVAELFPSHPMADSWRAWAIEMTDRFLEKFFEEDGTYHESVNYHAHAIAELTCFFYPLRQHGGRDFFEHPKVKGSFQHFIDLQMPFLSDHCCAPLPANGNSGGNGKELGFRELTTAASVYKKSDPELAAHLMNAWHTGGMPRCDSEHPALTEAARDMTIQPAAPEWKSIHRKGLGIVSKARMADGAPVWCLFRAGRATHHMDFDQGNLHVAAWDRVLLADHGYQTRDSDGSPLFAAATWLHSTVTYGEHRDLSSGYTGLELAPEPTFLHLDGRFDWVVHRIVNDNYRDLQRLRYNDIIPAQLTLHLRHYLFIKPNLFLVWDLFEEAAGPAIFRLTPALRAEEIGSGSFRVGQPGEPHLIVRFLLPTEPVVIENRRVGRLWTLAVQAERGAPFIALIAPCKEEKKIAATYDGAKNIIRVEMPDEHIEIWLPEPGSSSELPRVIRE